MPVKWDDLSPEAQERILKEHPDVAPPPPPPQADPPAPKASPKSAARGRRGSSEIRYTDAFPHGYLQYLETHPEYVEEINRPRKSAHASLLTKVLLLIGLAYALGAIFYACYGG